MNRETYEKYSDEELIALFRDGDQDAMETLLNKYKGMVLKKAKSMYILGGDSDDLIQEGMLGLFKAVRDYDCGRDASFHTFAQLCVTRQLYTAVTASSRKKHLPLNTAISLSRPVREENAGGAGAPGREDRKGTESYGKAGAGAAPYRNGLCGDRARTQPG